MERRLQLAQSLTRLRADISDACTHVGRSPNSVQVIAVTKNFPVSDNKLLLELGIHDMAESRDQQARIKTTELPAVNWHFIGQIQTNKISSIVKYSTNIHSVDRLEIVDKLAWAAAEYRQEPLGVFIQVNLDPVIKPGRGGVHPDAVLALAERIHRHNYLHLQGVMTIAYPGESTYAFEHLARISQRLICDYPHARAISAGMSNDFAEAIKYGATVIRVGGRLLCTN